MVLRLLRPLPRPLSAADITPEDFTKTDAQATIYICYIYIYIYIIYRERESEMYIYIYICGHLAINLPTIFSETPLFC